MSIVVPRLMQTLDDIATETSYPGSANQFARPAAESLAHLSGYILRGPVAAMRNRAPADSTSETIRFYTYRHANCDTLALWAIVGSSTQTTAKVGLTCGTGTEREAEAYFPGAGAGTVAIELMADWHDNDSGYCEVVIDCTDVGLYDFLVYEVYRDSLDAGEICVVNTDGTYVLGGLAEGKKIITSTTAGIKGLITETGNAWDNCIRSVGVWFGSELSTNGDWTNPFTDYVFRHIARCKTNTTAEPTRDLRVYAWSKTALGGGSCYWRCSSSVGADTVTSDELTHTSYAWTGSPKTGLACSTDSVDSLTFQIKGGGESELMYVKGVTIIEDS